MMKVSESLQEIWRITAVEASKPKGYYRRRVEEAGAAAVYAGVTIPGKMRTISIRIPESSKNWKDFAHETRGYIVSILAERDDRDGEDSGVHITETSTSLPKDLFLVFCADIIEHLRSAEDVSGAAKRLYDRLEHWRRFFEELIEEGLSRERLVGLYAELDFMERCIRAGISRELLVAAWGGPLGTNQDFLFGESAVEVKATTGNDADVVRITNLRQLDDTGLKHLYLAHCAYDFREGHGRTLAELIDSLKKEMEASATVSLSFSAKIAFAGVEKPLRSAFASYGFTVRKRRDYYVRAGFPRILENMLMSGISEVTYALHLSAAASFEIKNETLMTALTNKNA
jgi:hypothetical protein